MNNSNTPQNKLIPKDNYQNQYRVVYQYLFSNTATRYMTSIFTGVPLQNICRYVDDMHNKNLIAVISIGKCKISGHNAEYLSTNPETFPNDNQLTLWNENE